MRRRDALPDPEILRGLRELDAALAGRADRRSRPLALVADVEAARPEPSAAFLATLDARVHAGFPRAAGTAKAARTPWHVAPARAADPGSGLRGRCSSPCSSAAVALARRRRRHRQRFGIASPVARLASPRAEIDADGARAARQAPRSADSAATAPQPEAASTTSSGAAAPKSAPSLTAAAPAAPATSQQDRKVQRAADLTLTPKPDDVQKTADGVVRETQAAGGYVQRSDIATRDGGGEATFTLRIPSARLDDTLARLSKLAHVGALSQSASDITSAVVSAADQLSDARAERAALLRALGKATTDRQIASLKARLADNRSEIAQRKGALDAQRRRADLATVSVTVQGTGEAAEKDDGAWTPRDALHDAGRVLEIAGGVALIALAVLAPLAILAALALLAGRTLRRRRREGALDGAA